MKARYVKIYKYVKVAATVASIAIPIVVATATGRPIGVSASAY